jgi:uncharacterized membrane protein
LTAVAAQALSESAANSIGVVVLFVAYLKSLSLRVVQFAKEQVSRHVAAIVIADTAINI